MNKILEWMLYALTSAYTRKDYDNLKSGKPMETNIGKLFSIFSWGLGLVQEQADLIKLWDDLDYAKGSVLDRYGANFGVSRGGASDELYRLFIKVKMVAQLSGGDEDTVAKAAAEFLGVEYSQLLSEDVWPAKKNFYVDLSLISEERMALIEQIAHAIKRTMAAGVGFRLYVRTYRTYRAELRITYGSFVCAADIGTDAGARRAGVHSIDIHRAGLIWTWTDGGIPPNAQRSYENEVNVSHHGFTERHIGGSQPDAERAFSGDVEVSHGAFMDIGTNGGMPPHSLRRHEESIDVARLGFMEQHGAGNFPDTSWSATKNIEFSGIAVAESSQGSLMPDARRTLRSESGASGVLCHTRIKPRRID